MSTNVRFFGKINKEGKIIFHEPELWSQQVAALNNQEFEIIIKKRVRRPSPNQFNFLFGGILPSIMNTNEFSHYENPKELFDEHFAPMYLSYQVLAKKGKKSWLVNKERSLSELSKDEMRALIDKMLIYCGQNDITILSHEQYENKLYKTVDLDK
jgi:ABC-type amino acid transport substrate-binding protein